MVLDMWEVAAMCDSGRHELCDPNRCAKAAQIIEDRECEGD